MGQKVIFFWGSEDATSISRDAFTKWTPAASQFLLGFLGNFRQEIFRGG
jgi:hypothetical protein